MTFSWLPDAALDPHPRRTWLVEIGFDLMVLALYRKEIIWPSNYRLEPGTLIISNHQRDADVPILATALCQRQGVHLRQPLPFFSCREDLFRPGFLAEYAPGWPRPARALLAMIPLGWMFRIARCEPMRRWREFTLAETLNALQAAGLGNANPTAIFNARGQREIAAVLGKLPPRLSEIRPTQLAPLRLTYWGVRRLRISAFQSLKPGFKATVAAQLQRLARVLDDGRSLYFAPEGVISGNGKFGRIRAGARQLCQLAATPPRLRPLALSYDALGPGRLRVVVNVGERVHAPDLSRQASFAAALRQAILGLYTVTPSHLIARFLAAGPTRFTTQEFATWLRRATTAVTAAGLKLDPLLTRHSVETLAAKRLAWLARKRLIVREASHWRNHWPRDAVPGWQKPANVVRYLDNALNDLSPDLTRTLGS